MTSISDELKQYWPKCNCFESDTGRHLRMELSGHMTAAMRDGFRRCIEDTGTCNEARLFMLDDSIIGILNDIAISGTIIECGSVEAERETLRVLEGMEARLRDKIAVFFKGARECLARGGIERMNGRGEKIEGGNA